MIVFQSSQLLVRSLLEGWRQQSDTWNVRLIVIHCLPIRFARSNQHRRSESNQSTMNG